MFNGTFAVWFGILGGRAIYHSLTEDEPAILVWPGIALTVGSLLFIFVAQALWRRKWLQAMTVLVLAFLACVYGMPDR
jgi:hypothetical protein